MATFLLIALAAAIVSSLMVGLALRAKSAALAAQLQAAEAALAAAKLELSSAAASSQELRSQLARTEAELQHERTSAAEKLQAITNASNDMQNAFRALAANALESNNENFLKLAQATLGRFQAQAQGDLDQRQKAVESLVAPIKDSLTRVDSQIREIENSRREAYGSLKTQVESLLATEKELKAETANLVKALRTPNVRGRWGEIQLRRVVEIAGMLEHCDFIEQVSVTADERRLRPDLIVRLPGGKQVVVDAKAPLLAYLEAAEAQTEDIRRARLVDHARQVRDHMTKLAQKAYWDQFESADMVIMFLPGEMFFSAALEHDPGLIEYGVSQRVIPASPTTLIALLRAVAYGWQQEKITENAQRIATLGKELYERLCTAAGHMQKVGSELRGAVNAYNSAVSSLERRVLVSARKIAEFGPSVKGEIPELEEVELQPSALQSPDWKEEPKLLNLAAAAGDSRGD